MPQPPNETIQAVVKLAVQRYYQGASALGRLTLYDRIVDDPELRRYFPEDLIARQPVMQARIATALRHYGCMKRGAQNRTKTTDLHPRIFEPLTEEERARLRALLRAPDPERFDTLILSGAH